MKPIIWKTLVRKSVQNGLNTEWDCKRTRDRRGGWGGRQNRQQLLPANIQFYSNYLFIKFTAADFSGLLPLPSPLPTTTLLIPEAQEPRQMPNPNTLYCAGLVVPSITKTQNLWPNVRFFFFMCCLSAVSHSSLYVKHKSRKKNIPCKQTEIILKDQTMGYFVPLWINFELAMWHIKLNTKIYRTIHFNEIRISFLHLEKPFTKANSLDVHSINQIEDWKCSNHSPNKLYACAF